MDDRQSVYVIEVLGGMIKEWRLWSELDVRFDHDKAERFAAGRRKRFPNLQWRVVEYRRVEPRAAGSRSRNHEQ